MIINRSVSVPTIQLYNDRLAHAVDVQRHGQTAVGRDVTLTAFRQLFDNIPEDFEEDIDSFANRAAQFGRMRNQSRQIISTWSHFLRTKRFQQARITMCEISLPRSCGLDN